MGKATSKPGSSKTQQWRKRRINQLDRSEFDTLISILVIKTLFYDTGSRFTIYLGLFAIALILAIWLRCS
jgi:hypothetical protein